MSPSTPGGLGYQVKVEIVSGCGADLNIRSLLDRQQYSDPEGAAERAGIPAASWSLFGVVWPSARVLAGAMVSFNIEGQRVLELGCGLALASLVLHRRNTDITATDCHPLAGDFLKRNLVLNGMDVMRYEAAQWGRAKTQLGRFDLIIGSDVLYERAHPELLSQFIHEHSEADGRVVVVEPNRGHRSHFTREMNDVGFGVTSTAIAASPGLDERYRGRLLNYKRG